MNMNWMKCVGSAALAVLLLGNIGSSTVAAAGGGRHAAQPAAQAADAAVVEGKAEVVYANLDTSGAVGSVYVVNQFEVEKAGSITDYGAYSEVTNLTSTAALENAGGAVHFEAEAGNFYYQGTLQQDALPWLFDIRYYLDGAEISAEALAGKSGALEMRMASRQNPAVNEAFYNNYMLQISITLDTNKCRNIVAQNATMASAGKNRVAAYTVMPGKDADIRLTATVTDFAMNGLEIAGMPFSSPIEMPDTGGMVDEMVTLSDAIGEVNSGVGELASGVRQLNDGVGSLVSGSESFAGGLGQLSGGSAELVAGSAEIDKALSKIAKQLKGGGTDISLDDFAQLPAGLRQLAEGLGQASSGLGQLKAGYANMLAALDAAIMGLAAAPVSEEDIGALMMAVNALPDGDPTKPAAQAALANMIAAYTAGQTALGTYVTPDPESGVSIQAGMAAVTGSLETMAASLDVMVAALNTMADEMEGAMGKMDMLDGLKELAKGMATLAKQYGQFHEGLVAYTGGVAQVAAGYGQLHGGIVALGEGTGELASGTQQLYSGTQELNAAVADLPETIEVEIDKLMADYDKSDFVPVSFTSPQNSGVQQVQFVLMTPAIAAQEADAPAETEATPETVWDRITALFG